MVLHRLQSLLLYLMIPLSFHRRLLFPRFKGFTVELSLRVLLPFVVVLWCSACPWMEESLPCLWVMEIVCQSLRVFHQNSRSVLRATQAVLG